MLSGRRELPRCFTFILGSNKVNLILLCHGRSLLPLQFCILLQGSCKNNPPLPSVTASSIACLDSRLVNAPRRFAISYSFASFWN